MMAGGRRGRGGEEHSEESLCHEEKGAARGLKDFSGRGWAWILPRSLHSLADVRAARTQEKVGHFGPFGDAQGRRDDREEVMARQRRLFEVD